MERHAILDWCRSHGLDVYARDLFTVLMDAAGWKGPDRGVVRDFTAASWAEELGYSAVKVRRAARDLEAAGGIAWDRVKGHDGTVRVLIYDELAPDRDARRSATRARYAEEPAETQRAESALRESPQRAESALRPGETTTRIKELRTPGPKPEEHPEPTRAEPAGDSAVAATIEALRAQCARHGDRIPATLPRTTPLIAERLTEGWKPQDLAVALRTCRAWPPDGITNPDAFFASRATADAVGVPPRAAPGPRTECDTCGGSGWADSPDGKTVEPCSHPHVVAVAA